MVNKIIINSVFELSIANGYFLKAVKNIGYSTKYSISDILSKHGVKIGNSLFKNKAFSIDLTILGASPEDLLAKRAALYKYLTVDNYQENDKITFEFVLANNQSLILSGVLKDLSDDIDSEILVASPVNFVIETEYPFLTSKQQYLVSIPITKGGGGGVPMSIPFNMSIGTQFYTSLSNGGNVFAYPIYKFYGALTNPVILDTLLNKSMSLTATLNSNSIYTVDTYDRTVIDEAGNNKLDKISGDFLILRPDENRFKLSTDNVGDTGHVDVIYSYHYVSI